MVRTGFFLGKGGVNEEAWGREGKERQVLDCFGTGWRVCSMSEGGRKEGRYIV